MSGYVLEIVEGPGAGQRFALGSPVDIGREGGAGIMLTQDELISRRHARLSPRPEGVVLEDLASRNGTFVNGNEIYSPVLIMPGDEITVGVTVMEIRAEQAAGQGIRRVPEALTSARPAPLAVPGPNLAGDQREPDYLRADDSPASPEPPPIHRLLDAHTKHMARTAPLAIFVLVAIIVIIALALR